jgi:tartrate dehydratase alpha subunit/fumarate hydratase class I-like protein
VNFFLLIIAGNETTRNALSGGIQALCEHPEQLDRLRDCLRDLGGHGRALGVRVLAAANPRASCLCVSHSSCSNQRRLLLCTSSWSS